MTDVLTPNNETVLNERWDDGFRASMTSTHTMQNYAQLIHLFFVGVKSHLNRFWEWNFAGKLKKEPVLLRGCWSSSILVSRRADWTTVTPPPMHRLWSKQLCKRRFKQLIRLKTTAQRDTITYCYLFWLVCCTCRLSFLNELLLFFHRVIWSVLHKWLQTEELTPADVFWIFCSLNAHSNTRTRTHASIGMCWEYLTACGCSEWPELSSTVFQYHILM